MTTDFLLRFLPIGYAITITVETLFLLVLLSPRHPLRRKLIAGIWLTACTYPIVVLVMPSIPALAENRALYLWIAEIFAPAAECLLFWLAFGTTEPRSQKATARDMAAITLANVASFLFGEWLAAMGALDWLFAQD